MTGPAIDHYAWNGGREAIIRHGPPTGPILVAALPLFEEANRTRTFTVALMRALAGHGFASALPDLPGQGESLAALDGMTLPRLAAAMAAATDRLQAQGRPTYAIGIRSGALLDGKARHRGRWHFAPQTGAGLVRELHRTWRAAGGQGDHDAMLAAAPVEIAGTVLSADLLASLASPPPEADGPTRLLHLAGDRRPADRYVDAAPLWRLAEPGNDPALAALLAGDIADWIRRCEA